MTAKLGDPDYDSNLGRRPDIIGLRTPTIYKVGDFSDNSDGGIK